MYKDIKVKLINMSLVKMQRQGNNLCIVWIAGRCLVGKILEKNMSVWSRKEQCVGKRR